MCREFINFIALLHGQQRTDLDLREFPIMVIFFISLSLTLPCCIQSVKTELNMTLAHAPLILSLTHNIYFREIICADTPLTKDNMALFAKVLTHNR